MNPVSVIINDEAIEQGATFDDETVKANGTEPVGSVRNIVDAASNNVVLKKQADGRWAPVGGSGDLLNDVAESEETDVDGKPVVRKRAVDTSLIPYGEQYLANGFNVMLIALHGVGKTVSIKNLCEHAGIKWKYYSCATLDPYTDLVGIPTPRDYCPACKLYFKDEAKCPECSENTVESLKMVRPRDVDEAELIFFDEFNRADPKVQNAVFEIIQFGSINGEPLPHLKACWAAMNPPDSEQNYAVEAIDPALLDRFDIYIDITPKPSVSYMSKFMPEPIAVALKVWWDDHQNAIRNGSKDAHSDYISPRRLEKIGLVWCATHNTKSVYASLPRGDFEKKKLIDTLRLAQKKVDGGVSIDDEYDEDDLGGAGLGDRPNPDFEPYRRSNMKLQATKLAKYLSDNPGHEATHNKVVEVLTNGVGGEELVDKFSEILDALNPAKLEGLMSGFPPPKVNQMKEGFANMYDNDVSRAKKLPTLYKVLNAQTASKNPVNWPTSL